MTQQADAPTRAVQPTAGDAFHPPPAGVRVPATPKSIAETGLGETFLQDLALKHIYAMGAVDGFKLADLLKLHFSIVNVLIDSLKKQELIMAQGGSWTLGAGIRHSITELGRKKVDDILGRDNYRGPAPVPLDQFVQQLKSQSIRGHAVSPDQVRKAFSRLVLEPDLVDRLGAAINSGRSIFLYGPPGNGKTSIAECIIDSIGGAVFIPHAVMVDAEIIRVFDELYHKPLETAEEHDHRWRFSRRPIVVVGGELTLSMLDLTWPQQATFYEAPFQLKAASGVLFIDDFGRQHCPPRDLLNRWIVPLENGFDFLAFRSGQKIKVPFDNLIVFSTNLDPADLVDEAFLRRIRYKVEVRNPDEAGFRSIFRSECAKRSIPCSEDALDHLVKRHYQAAGRDFRCCHPRDLLEQMIDIQTYSGQMPALSAQVIDRLCTIYFVDLGRKRS